jgi:hypothetical protein
VRDAVGSNLALIHIACPAEVSARAACDPQEDARAPGVTLDSGRPAGRPASRIGARAFVPKCCALGLLIWVKGTCLDTGVLR